MQQIIKRYLGIVLLAVGLQTSWGFALLGPLTLANGADAWQNATIGYDLAYMDTSLAGDPVFLGDLGGPRNIAEEYRRNVPILYYTYDSTFLNFFGADGAAEVDAAYALMNTVPSADSINLSLFPDQTLQYNYTAMADFLTDIKSVTLHLLVEQLGLADPERFVWTLHDRALLPGTTCPIGEVYTVVGRNYDDYLNFSVNNPLYSSYVNDNLYTYLISEICTGPNPLAVTVPFSTDPEAQIFTAVAANNFDGEVLGAAIISATGLQPTSLSGGLQIGSFYTGLTRDDVAGLKYLFTTNNVNYELPDPTALLFSVVTNFSLQQKFPNLTGTNIIGTNGGYFYFDGTYGYGDYGWLVATSLTNSPAVLQTLYPGLLIASSSNYFVLATNWIYTQYFTNLTGPGTPYPPPLTLVTASNPQPYLLEKFVTTFANVFPDKVRSTTSIKQQIITVAPNIGAGYPAPPLTNVTSKTITLNTPSGDFFLLPLFHTNVCWLDILYTGLTNVQAITNVLTGTTTNIVTATNTSTYSSTLIQISYFTNYTFVTHPVICGEVTNAANLYQGIGGTKFQRADYDSLLSQTFDPVTNYYHMVVLTNSQWQTRSFVRVVTQPDILMDAADQGQANTFIGSVFRNINFTPSPALNGLAGPGTIDAPSVITYDKIGESVWNGYDIQTIGAAATNSFLGQYGSIPALAWASFGASTNTPELYPNGISIQNLENELAIQLTPSGPPDGSVGVPYSQQFSASGGAFSPPFTWLATGYPIAAGVLTGLPPGLVMSSTGLLTGTPGSAGTYDFVLQLTDSLGRSVQWNLSITIN